MKKIIAILTVIVILISVSACNPFEQQPQQTQQPSESTQATTAPTGPVDVENAAELYQEAAAAMENQDLRMTVSQSVIETIGDAFFAKNIYQSIDIDVSDAENHRYHVNSELSSGEHLITTEEYYQDGVYYLTLSGTPFSSKCSEDAFLKMFPSPDLLDPSLYTEITGIDTGDEYQLVFSGATAIEGWFNAAEVQLESASGSARLSKDKQLLSASYTVTYLRQSVQIEHSFEVTTELAPIDIVLPESDSTPLSISAPAAPVALEQAVGYLLQAEHLSGVYNEEISFEAFGDLRKRNITYSVNSINPLSAQVITDTTLTSSSTPDQSDISVKKEKFADGLYTFSLDGAEETTDASIDEAAMYRYLQNQQIGTIMLPQFIEQCSVKETDKIIRYTYIGNAAYADFLWENACQQLYQDTEILAGEDVETKELTCYLELDAETHLPISSGVLYSGNQKIDGKLYPFTYKASQTYTYTAA